MCVCVCVSTSETARQQPCVCVCVSYRACSAATAAVPPGLLRVQRLYEHGRQWRSRRVRSVRRTTMNPFHRLPDPVVVDVASLYLSLEDAVRWTATCRHARREIAPLHLRQRQRQWLTWDLHPRERAAVAAGHWHARAIQVLRYRTHRTRWAHHLVRDVRVPRPWLCRLSRWVPRVATLPDVHFDLVQHVACDLWHARPALASCPVSPAVAAMTRLPWTRLVHGPWTLARNVLYRDGRWIAGVVVGPRVWPTVLWNDDAATWLTTLGRRPADGLLRYCTRCPFCGGDGVGGGGSGAAMAMAATVDPVSNDPWTCGTGCAFQWAAWAGRWAAWATWRLPVDPGRNKGKQRGWHAGTREGR